MRITDYSLAGSLCALALCGAGSFAGPYEQRTLNAEQASRDIGIFREAIETVHPGFGRFTSAAMTSAQIDALERDARNGITDADLYLRISTILGHLRCDHTLAELPDSIEAHRRESPSYMPLRFKLFAGRMYIETPGPGTGLGRADEILAINGRPAGDLIDAVEPFMAIDGFTESSRRVPLEYSNEFLGDGLNHFWPFLWGWPEQWDLSVRSAGNGEVRNVSLEPVTYPVYQEIATGSATRYGSNFDTSVRFEMLDAQTAYLSIGTFVNYRNNADPYAILGPHFDAMRQADADHLILDLRACGGGSDEVPAALLTLLIDEPYRQAVRPNRVKRYRYGDLLPYLDTWDRSVFELPDALFTPAEGGFYEVDPAITPGAFAELQPRENRFAGRLSLLVGPANASGATNFAARLRESRGDVRLVGSATGGSAEGPTAGLMVFLDLPESGIRVRVPLLRQFNNVTSFTPGMGVEPDVEIVQPADDYFEGRDTVLERARVWE